IFYSVWMSPAAFSIRVASTMLLVSFDRMWHGHFVGGSTLPSLSVPPRSL
ncbi:MAG: hypothetical protein JWN42_1084, partial [Candidatus Angelobacter sp.]|nr:hypothetical protein [Candidatus Angelobacter sp.]